METKPRIEITHITTDTIALNVGFIVDGAKHIDRYDCNTSASKEMLYNALMLFKEQNVNNQIRMLNCKLEVCKQECEDHKKMANENYRQLGLLRDGENSSLVSALADIEKLKHEYAELDTLHDTTRKEYSVLQKHHNNVKAKIKDHSLNQGTVQAITVFKSSSVFVLFQVLGEKVGEYVSLCQHRLPVVPAEGSTINIAGIPYMVIGVSYAIGKDSSEYEVNVRLGQLNLKLEEVPNVK